MNQLVSCLCPTYNRRQFIPKMLRCFETQDYKSRELIILDDGSDPIADLLPLDSRIQYYYEPPKRNHGQKMNRCCELAKGDLVMVFDDDDWYAPDRISRQIAPFVDPQILLTGTSRLYYYVYGTQQAYRYQNWTPTKWLAAFALRKSVWENQKFEPLHSGADTRMINSLPQGSLKDLNDLGLLVSTIHPTNASSKILPNVSFIEIPWEEIEKLMKEPT